MPMLDVANDVVTPEGAEILAAWLTFAASAISALAWPIAVIVLTLLLRNQVPSALGALKRFKGWGVEAEFERDVSNLVAVAEVTASSAQRKTSRDSGGRDAAATPSKRAVEPTTADGTAEGEAAPQLSFKRREVKRHTSAVERAATLRRRKQALVNATRIALTDQKGAVLMAWGEVEATLLEFSGVDDTPPGINPGRLVEHMAEQRLLPPELLVICRGLLHSRNKIQYDPNFTPSLSAVYQYIDLAQRVITEIYMQ